MCGVKKFTKLVVATAIYGVALIAAVPSHAASGEEIIKSRIYFMEEDMGGPWKVLAAFARNGKGTLAEVEDNAIALAMLSKKIATHFPKDTGRGNYPEKMTRALPVIWTNQDGFRKDIQRLADGSEKLARLAKEGNKDAVVAMIGASGNYARTQIGCAECHKTFRGEKAK